MTITTSQLDELEAAVVTCRKRGMSTMHHSACSPAVTLQLVAITRAALALKSAGLEGDEVIRLMNASTNADEYCAACTLAPRVEEKRRAALRDLDAALRGIP